MDLYSQLLIQFLLELFVYRQTHLMYSFILFFSVWFFLTVVIYLSRNNYNFSTRRLDSVHRLLLKNTFQEIANVIADMKDEVNRLYHNAMNLF